MAVASMPLVSVRRWQPPRCRWWRVVMGTQAEQWPKPWVFTDVYSIYIYAMIPPSFFLGNICIHIFWGFASTNPQDSKRLAKPCRYWKHGPITRIKYGEKFDLFTTLEKLGGLYWVLSTNVLHLHTTIHINPYKLFCSSWHLMVKCQYQPYKVLAIVSFQDRIFSEGMLNSCRVHMVSN